MPWNASSVVQKRAEFIEEWAEGRKSKSQLCEEYGISRKTGYSIWDRFCREGEAALEDGSRRPRSCPHRTPTERENEVVALRLREPDWGPKKLGAALAQAGGKSPSPSTIAAILKRQGLSRPQRRRRHEFPTSPPLIVPGGPNVVWSTDFKGCFHVGTGERCDPLTVMDGWSRFLLLCECYFSEPGKARQEEVIELYGELFRRYGVPRYILSDNGGPFASVSPGGLTKLSVFWIRLGITPLRIASGKPQQNGRLERMHRTLKSAVATPPQRTVEEQRRCVAAFVEKYNTVRPHEALGQRTPASVHRAGVPWDGIIPEPIFPEGAVERSIARGGALPWHGRLFQMPGPLLGQRVGLVPVGDGHEQAMIYLNKYCVGVLDLATGRILSAPRSAQLLRLGGESEGEERAIAVREPTV
jgi:transposase InsO family protein